MAGSFAKIAGHRMVLDTKILGRMTAEMRPEAEKIVEKYGLMVASTAAQNAPVDTGSLRNSILAQSRMARKTNITLENGNMTESTTTELTFVVSDGVEYGVYQEFGTSKMGAWPFMTPAIEAWADRFMNAFSELFK
jgi:HK97 gp10 family phage protein